MTPETANERFHRRLLMAVQRLRGRPVGAYIRQLQQWERLEPGGVPPLACRTVGSNAGLRQKPCPALSFGPLA